MDPENWKIENTSPHRRAGVSFGNAGMRMQISVDTVYRGPFAILLDQSGKVVSWDGVAQHLRLEVLRTILDYYRVRGWSAIQKQHSENLLELDGLLQNNGYRIDLASDWQHLTIVPVGRTHVQDKAPVMLDFENGPFVAQTIYTTEWAEVPEAVLKAYMQFYDQEFLAFSLATRLGQTEIPALNETLSGGVDAKIAFVPLAFQWAHIPEGVRARSLKILDEEWRVSGELMSTYWLRRLKEFGLSTGSN